MPSKASSQYSATIFWSRYSDELFTDNKYHRSHDWSFEGGLTVPASSSPHIVPIPYSEPGNIDPEAAFVAALSSCHMLFFLSIAAKKGFVVEHYEDLSIGTLERNAAGKMAMSQVVLKPEVSFTKTSPTPSKFEAWHHEAHALCFIANSVTTEVLVQARIKQLD